MRLELRTSGGVAGIRRPPVTVETSERADGATLEALAASVAERARAGAAQRPAGADQFQYDLGIDDVTVRLYEGALTPEAEELLKRLRASTAAG
jgi:hypothetical protein